MPAVRYRVTVVLLQAEPSHDHSFWLQNSKTNPSHGVSDLPPYISIRPVAASWIIEAFSRGCGGTKPVRRTHAAPVHSQVSSESVLEPTRPPNRTARPSTASYAKAKP